MLGDATFVKAGRWYPWNSPWAAVCFNSIGSRRAGMAVAKAKPRSKPSTAWSASGNARQRARRDTVILLNVLAEEVGAKKIFLKAASPRVEAVVRMLHGHREAFRSSTTDHKDRAADISVRNTIIESLHVKQDRTADISASNAIVKPEQSNQTCGKCRHGWVFQNMQCNAGNRKHQSPKGKQRLSHSQQINGARA